MSKACPYCTASKGLTLQSDHLFETDEELFDHFEMVHDLPVRREGETNEQALERVRAKNPHLGGPDCQCPDCLHKRGNPLADTFRMVDIIREKGGE